MAKKAYKHYSLMVPDGGNLITGSNSQDTAGATNYVEKINFRRETDGEVRREGWSNFNVGGTEVSKLDSSDAPIRMLHQFQSEGKKVLVSACADKIYRFKEETDEWVMIAEGLFNLDELGYSDTKHAVVDKYDLKPTRWEVVTIDGYCIMNNGVDLPLYYRDGWPCAFPLFSLRERGIIRVGTISEFDGRLFIADIEYFDETIENNFSYFMSAASFPYDIPENFYDYDDYVTTYKVPHIIEFSSWRLADDQREARAAPNLFGQNYEAEVYAMSNGAIITLALDYPLGGTRETGSSGYESFTHNPYYFFSQSELANLDYTHSTFIAGDSIRMTVTDSLGVTKVYDADIVSINSNWVTGNTFIVLQGAYNNTSPGVVTSTGDEQAGSTQNVVVGDKANFILLKEPDTFSSELEMVRESSDSIAFPEDGSRILRMSKLGDKLMVYRQTGYLSISRGDKYTAFYYEERYKGERVADFRHTVINIDEQRQMFAGFNGVFVVSSASVEPIPFPQYMNGPEFWRLISSEEIEYVFSVENPMTQEILTTTPIGFSSEETSLIRDWGMIGYDLLQGTISQIDYAMTSMAALFPTEKIDSRRFIMGTHLISKTINSDGTVAYSSSKFIDSESFTPEVGKTYFKGARIVRYGYGSSEVDRGPYREFSRNGLDYSCTLRFGKADLNDKFSEKKMRSYALHMSDIFDYSSYTNGGYVEDDFTDTAVIANVKLSTFSTTQQTEVEEVEQELEDLSSEVMIPLFAQGNYFQDVITLKGIDQPFKILGRTIEVSGVRTKLTSEVVQGGS
jgi:hypothetical protein